jgi:hypothetical protein
VLHRLPERAAAPRRWSLAISAIVGSAALAAVLIVAVAIVGLPFIGSRLGPAAPAATSGPSVAAGTASPPASAAAADLRTFDEGGLAFAYPAAWHEFHYVMTSSFSNQIAYLATVDIPEPCTTTVDPSFTTTQCANRYQLTPGTLVVSISGGGSPGFDMTASRPAGSTALTIGGLPAYLETISTPAADQELRWTLSSSGLVDNFYSLDAQMRGPGIEAMRAQLEALIASVRYDPPVVPLPTGSATAADVPICKTSQLEITTTNSGAAGGMVGVYLRFINRGNQACSLHGWPTVIGVTASGATTTARNDPAGMLPFPDIPIQTVSLKPGDDAFAALSGGDNSGSAAACPPSYHTFRVTPPGSTQSVVLSAFNIGLNTDFTACVGLVASPIVSAAQMNGFIVYPLRP